MSAHWDLMEAVLRIVCFFALQLCCFLDSHHKVITPGWVECTICGQLVHDICMGVTAATFSLQDDLPCGCDCLQKGEF